MRRYFKSRLVALPALVVLGVGTWAVIASASGGKASKAGAGAGVYASLRSAAQDPISPDALAPSDAEMLPGTATAIDDLGSLHGRSFYAVSLSDGRRCVASGPAASTSYRFGFVKCSAAGASGGALADLSIYSFRPTGDVHLVRLEGLAANGIAAVEVVGRGGSLGRTPVVGNKFAAAVAPSAPVVALAALDAAGKRVATVRTSP
jgi:hypothetical protein